MAARYAPCARGDGRQHGTSIGQHGALNVMQRTHAVEYLQRDQGIALRVMFPGVFHGSPCRDAMPVRLPACAPRSWHFRNKSTLLSLVFASLSRTAMAKITISCSIPVEDEAVTEFLHKYLGRSRLGTARILRMGEKGCFYAASLYRDDHAKVSRLMRRMLAFFESKSIPLTILKIGAQDSWYEVDPEQRDPWKIAPQALLALLDAASGGDAQAALST
jgi:hypothetical protein